MNGSHTSSKVPLHIAIPTAIFSRKALLAILAASIGLAGCEGEEQAIENVDNNPAEIIFSYPANEQTGVPVTTPIFLRFTHASTLDEDALDSKMLTLKSDQGEEVALDVPTFTSQKKGVTTAPKKTLKPATRYTLTHPDHGIKTNAGYVTLPGSGPNGSISFTTAPATQGPLLDRTEGTGFKAARLIPNGTDNYPITDISTFRIQFTEPLNEQTVTYGDSVSLRDAENNLVPAEMFVQHHRITIDPNDELDPSKTYTIKLSKKIESSIVSNALTPPTGAPWTFQPLDSTSPSGDRQRMAQTATTDTGQLALSGEDYNSVKLSSLLLGENTTTTATGTVFAELGFIPKFESSGLSVPLRINRGALMTGSSVNVNVAGALPAGLSSENIDVRFLSDATGFLVKNTNTDNKKAPRLVELYLDLTLNTGNKIANAALSQELLHVHLIGAAEVTDGTLSIEATGVIEPDVLGVDVASGLISFRLEGYASQDDAPLEEGFEDNVAPEIKSWVPGKNNQNKILPGDPVIVYFSEPVLPSTVTKNTVELRKNSSKQDITYTLNGSALVITPKKPLAHGVKYNLSLNGITDLTGFHLPTASLDFELAPTNAGTSKTQSPLALATLPGFPCNKTSQWRCNGGKNSDDVIPEATHPSNKPLIVRFSQDMKQSTIKAGVSVVIDQYVNSEWESVPTSDYVIETAPRLLTITPLAGWHPGRLYKYTLNHGDSQIRSLAGLGLKTKILTQGTSDENSRKVGGEPLVNRFKAAEPANDNTLLALRSLPMTDANADFDYWEGREAGSKNGESVPNSIGLEVEEVSSLQNSDTLVEEANIGCVVGTTPNCDKNKYVYLAGMLDVLVAGATDSNGEIPLDILPTVLMTTSADVHVKIDTELLDLLDKLGILTTDITENEIIETGPLMLRIRYKNGNPPQGQIYSDGKGGLMIKTTLDVYLDAPYLDPTIGPAVLQHYLRSYELNDLVLRGPIKFMEDGRMQITLDNDNPIRANVDVTGEIDLEQGEIGGLCSIAPKLCGAVANGLVNIDTRIGLEIPEKKLHLNFITPFTQQ